MSQQASVCPPRSVDRNQRSGRGRRRKVNAVQAVLHLSGALHAGGFWLPSSWSAGRWYAYEQGCFKLTASAGAAFDSGWIDDAYLGLKEPERKPDWQVTPAPLRTTEPTRQQPRPHRPARPALCGGTGR